MVVNAMLLVSFVIIILRMIMNVNYYYELECG